MGSLRNPIGPLPSTIYWRRRAVASAVLALLVLLIVWAFSFGGGGGRTNGDGKGGGHGPASSITPGPSHSGPAITQRPGGREDSGGGGSTGGGSGGGSDDAGGSGGTGGSGSSGSSGSGGDGGAGGAGGGAVWVPGGSGSGSGSGTGSGSGSSSGSGSGSAGGAEAPPASGLADCSGSDVTVTLHSKHRTYKPDQKPAFELKVKSKRDSACQFDLGRTATVVTIKDDDGDTYWSSDDCSGDHAAMPVRLAAKGTTKHTFTWLRTRSSGDCTTSGKNTAKPGDYTIKVAVEHLKKTDTEFTLAKK